MTTFELGAALMWFALYAAAVFTQIRLSPRRSPALIAVGTAFLAAVASAPVALVAPANANYWHSFIVFSFSTLLYLMIFGATYKSISLRILLDLLRAPERKLSADKLFANYVSQESFHARIEVMVAHGLARRLPEGIHLTPKGRRFASAIEKVQRLYNIESSG